MLQDLDADGFGFCIDSGVNISVLRQFKNLICLELIFGPRWREPRAGVHLRHSPVNPETRGSPTWWASLAGCTAEQGAGAANGEARKAAQVGPCLPRLGDGAPAHQDDGSNVAVLIFETFAT